MPADSRSEKDKSDKREIAPNLFGGTLVNKATGKQAVITSRTSKGLYYVDTTTGKKYYTTFNQQGTLSHITYEVPEGGAWIQVPTPVTIGILHPVTPPSAPSDQRFVTSHGPPSQVKLASSKIELIQSLLKICESNKEFSMARSDQSDLILEEKVVPQKFLGITVGSAKKAYRARIWLDDGRKEVKYQEIEDQSRSVGVIPPGKGGFGLKPFDTKALGKAQDNPLADRMRGSIRQVVESAGWRLSYAS